MPTHKHSRFDAMLKSGAAAGIPGKVRNAFQFDGVDDIADTTRLLSSKGSIEFWVNRGWIGRDHVLIGTFGAGFLIGMSGLVGSLEENSLWVHFGGGSEIAIGVPNPVPRGVWSHIAVTFDYDNDQYFLYVNGDVAGHTESGQKPDWPLSFGGSDSPRKCSRTRRTSSRCSV